MKCIAPLKHASLFTVLALGYASLAQSQQDPRLAEIAGTCEFPELPTIPNAEGATMEQMVATQGAIQAYLEASNELLACLEGISQNESLADEDRQLALETYNAEVANQENAAEEWNVQRTRFLEMQNSG